MRQTLRWALMAVTVSLIHTTAADAQTPKFLGSKRDWSVYEVNQGSDRVCYIASEPSKQSGNYAKRGDPAVLVARLPGEPPSEQVSVQPGYPYRKDSLVEVSVEGQGFRLFTQGEHAWARTSDDDKALIEAMKRGSTMTVKGTSTRGTYSLDTYSLGGFSAAYQAMRDACAKP